MCKENRCSVNNIKITARINTSSSPSALTITKISNNKLMMLSPFFFLLLSVLAVVAVVTTTEAVVIMIRIVMKSNERYI